MKHWQPCMTTAMMNPHKVNPLNNKGANVRMLWSKSWLKTKHNTTVIAIGCKSDQPMPRMERR